MNAKEFRYTKMIVSEYGYLHPARILDKIYSHYAQRGFRYSEDETVRRWMEFEQRPKDITNPQLLAFMGALTEAVERESAVGFVNRIDEVLLVEGTKEIFLYMNPTDRAGRVVQDKRAWLQQLQRWFDDPRNTDREKLAGFAGLQIVFAIHPPVRRSCYAEKQKENAEAQAYRNEQYRIAKQILEKE